MSERPFTLPFDPTGIVLDRRQGLSRQLYHALRPVSYTHLTLPTTPYV